MGDQLYDPWIEHLIIVLLPGPHAKALHQRCFDAISRRPYEKS